jgi:hypothetical protein
MKDQIFLTLERFGWSNRPEALANLAAKEKFVDQWLEVERNIPLEAKTKALVNDLRWLVSKYELHANHLPQFGDLSLMLSNRDLIHILLSHLKDVLETYEFEKRINQADEFLKFDFGRNPNRYKGTQRYREQFYVSKERWWWYMDEIHDK